MIGQAIAALRLEPALPLWLLAILTAACVAASALALARRARGAWLRASAFAVLLAWLAGPTLVRETRQSLSDIALLVTDRTASMQAGGSAANAQGGSAASAQGGSAANAQGGSAASAQGGSAASAQGGSAAISKGGRTAMAQAAETAIRAEAARIPGLELRSIAVPPGGHDGTLLWAATRQALADIPADRLAGIVAITDGQIHDLPSEPPAAPVHALIPAAGEEWDRRVRVVEAPTYGIVGHSVDLRVVVEDLGPGTHGPARLIVQQDGAAPETREIQPGAIQTVPVAIARAGPVVIKLATDPAPGEASPLNNQEVVQITGVRDRLRVLLVSGEPNQGERTWRRLLKSDPAVDLVHFTILRPPEKDDTTPLNELALIAFPTRELFQEKLSGFDLIILDRFTDRGILPHLYLRNIADYVRRGGALLLTVGPEFASSSSLDQTPLSTVLPAHAPASGDGVLNEAFVPAVTDLGARHPVTETLPGSGTTPGTSNWGPWYRAIAADDVQGQVLMTGPEKQPLLILDHVGQGRTALLMSDQIWLWSRGHKGGGPQAELLRRIAHWLMKEPELDEERLSASIEGGKLDVERRSVAGDAAATVKITPPSGPERRLVLRPAGPGRAIASLDAGTSDGTGAGVWQASDGTHVAFAVLGQDNKREFADLRATAEKMRPLVDKTGGGIVWLAGGPPALRMVANGADASGRGWIGLRRRGAHVVTGVSTEPLLPPWIALPLLLGLVVAAWRRESQS